MIQKGDSRYKKFIDICFIEVKRVLRPYSDKFSKKTYTQHQHAVAILLMKRERKPYRDVVELLKEFWACFGFNKSIPHFTTLEKFFMRIPTYVWDFLLAKTYQLFAGTIADVAIDSTGYRQHHASQHYEKRIDRPFRRKRFMKHFLSVDTNRQAIIASYDRRSYVNDTLMFKPIMKKIKEIIDIGYAVADKGFDSESNHKFAHKIGADSVIPLRYRTSLSKTKGYYRRKLWRNFPKERYNRRSIVETINSVEKRKFGDELRSRLLKTQRREMKVIDIVYNIHRYINYVISVLEGFLQSQIKEKNTRTLF